MKSYEKYQELQEKVNMQIGTLTEQITAHAPGGAGLDNGDWKYGIGWGKCGDLGHVAEQLQEVIDFLGRS